MLEARWLSVVALVLACTTEPTPATDEASGAQPEVENPSDALARAECERIRDDFTQGECRAVQEQLRLLSCATAPPDDPACIERKAAESACLARAAAFFQAHSMPGPDDIPPMNWTCEFPPPPPEPLARARFDSPPPLPSEWLLAMTCTKQYARLRGLPNVDRDMLEYAWKSSECQGRHEALLDALAQFDRVHWAPKWAATGKDATHPWRLPPQDRSERDRIVAAMSTWCDATACRVLGRCVAAVLPRDHPRFPGALTCVARDESACKASQACAVEGRCRLDPTTSACVPGDHDDCARSTLCAERQLCRRVVGPMGASCGGTTPKTSGIDTIGFIDNPALGLRKAVLDVQSETIDGPLAEVMVGLSKSQIADLASCLDLRLAVAPSAAGSFSLVIYFGLNGHRSVSIGSTRSSLVDDDESYEECIEREVDGWKFPAAKGTSSLWFSATFRAE